LKRSVRRVQPQIAMERDGGLSREAPKLPPQRTLGRGGGDRDLSNREMYGEIVPHKLDGPRDTARNRPLGLH
jgi:hypothetical protein